MVKVKKQKRFLKRLINFFNFNYLAMVGVFS